MLFSFSVCTTDLFIGPFKMEGSQVHINDGPRVTVNPYSWTKVHIPNLI